MLCLMSSPTFYLYLAFLSPFVEQSNTAVQSGEGRELEGLGAMCGFSRIAVQVRQVKKRGGGGET